MSKDRPHDVPLKKFVSGLAAEKVQRTTAPGSFIRCFLIGEEQRDPEIWIIGDFQIFFDLFQTERIIFFLIGGDLFIGSGKVLGQVVLFPFIVRAVRIVIAEHIPFAQIAVLLHPIVPQEDMEHGKIL
jgi:hypothetical protein